MASGTLLVAIATSLTTVCVAFPTVSVGRGPVAHAPGGGRGVIKGQVAARGEFPWQAQLKKNGAHVCGAILIEPYWLLTAAHCLSGLEDLKVYQVVLGEYDVSEEEGSEQRRDVAEVVFYDGRFGDSRSPRSTREHDIALIRLHQPAIYTEWVQPIPLPAAADDFTGVAGVAAGWGATGATQDGPIYPNRLQKITLTVLTDEQCLADLVFFNYVSRTMACAEPPLGSSLCWGDSGGALTHYRPGNGQPVLAAITSWGVDCGLDHLPAVFVDVTYYLTWISDVITSTLYEGI